MAQKITLTPQQIALAQSDDIDPNLTTDMGDDGLEEVAEDTSTDNDPPEGNEDYTNRSATTRTTAPDPQTLVQTTRNGLPTI